MQTSSRSSGSFDGFEPQGDTSRRYRSGVQTTRVTTDKICLVAFLVCFGLFGIMTWNNLAGVDIKRFTTPTDSTGQMCDQTYPYLYVDVPDKSSHENGFVLAKRTCVSTCPDYKKSNLSDQSALPVLNCRVNSLHTSCGTFKLSSTIQAFSLCVPTDLETYKRFSQALVSTDMTRYVTFMFENYGYLIKAALYSIVLSVVYALLLKYLAFPIILLSIFGTIAVVAYGGYISYSKSKELEADLPTAPDAKKLASAVLSYYTIAVVTWTGCGVGFLVACFMLAKIRAAAQIISQACHFTTKNKSVIIIPLMSGVGLLFVGFLAYLSLLGLLAKNQVSQQDLSNTSRIFSVEGIANKYQALLAVFVLLWMLKAVFTWAKLSIATVVCLWYHDQHEGVKATVKGAYWSARYHLGTVYLASLVLNLATLLQRVLDYIEDKSRIATSSNSLWLRAIGCIGRLIAQFIETFTSQALTEVALTSENLCKAGSQVSRNTSLNMIARNSPTMMLFSFAKLLVASAATIIVHLEIKSQETAITSKDFSSIESIKKLLLMTPTMAVVFLISWLTTCIYCYIWEVAAETLINLKAFESVRGAPKNDKVEDLSTLDSSIQYA